MMYSLDAHDPSAKQLNWANSRGGFQDARASEDGAEWYVENVFEFLDHPNEYYYSPEQSALYMWHNGTGAPSGELVATQLQTLLELKGTQSNPVADITISNIKFKDAAQTFMEPHGVPSCGDWALQRMAGVFFEGTINTVVDGCTFERMDGNGLMLSKYNRNAYGALVFWMDSAIDFRFCHAAWLHRWCYTMLSFS
jgi:hypothetical protein